MEERAAEYVGFWRRALAFTIDNLIWLIAPGYIGLDALFQELYDQSVEAGAIATFAYFSLWFNYFAFCEWRWGKTAGKAATSISVVSLEGGELSFGQASVRGLLRLVDVFVIGWVTIAASERKQRLGDKAANTAVVRNRPKPLPPPDPSSRLDAPGADPPGGTARAVPAPPPPAPQYGGPGAPGGTEALAAPAAAAGTVPAGPKFA